MHADVCPVIHQHIFQCSWHGQPWDGMGQIHFEPLKTQAVGLGISTLLPNISHALSAPQLPFPGGCRTPNSSQPDPGHSMGTSWTQVVCNSHQERPHSLRGPNSQIPTKTTCICPSLSQIRTELRNSSAFLNSFEAGGLWGSLSTQDFPPKSPQPPAPPLQSIIPGSLPPRQPGDSKVGHARAVRAGGKGRL